MVLALVRLRGVRVHAEQDTPVIAPYAGPDDGMALSRTSPGFTRVIPGGPRAGNRRRLPALRTAIRRNRAVGDEESDCRPITTNSSR
ncbi:hypothetical protein QF035_007347 [Streptomyces umbrinus]|uniref:Uncharacterized protein n=1 Tax=Streptomyces umbrinus TaxID=67370 RepID=A0ABU0T1S8_9ACTN|nr:hypothetical protein [Streptomyces umbrinus]